MVGTLLVVYDRGAASATEIASGLSRLGPVAFAVADSAHTRQVGPVLAALGHVVPLTGYHRQDVATARRLSPAAILTFSERMLPATAALATTLGLPGHDPATARLLTDKVRQRARLRAEGVEDMRSHPVSSLDEWPVARSTVGLPAVLKPIHGEGSRHTHAVHDDASARSLLAALLPAVPGSTVLVEELLQGRSGSPFGDYVSVESMCGPQGTIHLGVTGKFPLVRPFREAGRFWPAPISTGERAAVTELVSRALAALGVRVGLTHTEVKLTAAGPRIIEVNGRLGGHIPGLAKQVNGTDLVRLAGALALGRNPEPPCGLDTPRMVHFQHNTLAPTERCTLVAVHGAAEVRRTAGVDGFRTYERPGAAFEHSVMTRHLDLLWGRARDHDQMLAVLDEALGRLSYEFRFADGIRRITATDLRQGG